MAELRHDSYAKLAAEYYDRNRHPTCANFRDGSMQILERWLPDSWPDEGWICETGAGRSVVKEIAGRLGLNQRKLIVLDSVREMTMMTNSEPNRCSSLVVADSLHLPIADATVSLIVASLGDPYNTQEYWSEVARVAKPGSTVLFTTPSFAWSNVFRKNDSGAHEVAAFDLRDGSTVSVPSFIYEEGKQTDLMATQELQVDEIESVSVRMLDSTLLSPKLECVGDGEVVTGYRAVLAS